ncbi:nuclear transport factor 2 family protein [Acidaminobacter sp. JC074]|uniref:nuclear transport factor 2 family protein n=1 Tax=Acidaminobacter sp. JC074 TaxID=2530199 RepID=UPI001F0E1300|nr:nuclear transport factor 2 family protein [Acidaminobacter sp. JC074]MCH4886905.1 nuclear transport factor 2 family protein [Acidaminobacter sp. JC074]
MKFESQVKRLFIATDSCDWETVKEVFCDKVELDYSSLSGQPAAELKASDIIDSWKGLLPGFTHTHHQIGNILSVEKDGLASVFCYGTATHYLENEAGNIWTVVGTYDLDLVEEKGTWRISKMKFNFKYQDGNTNLPQAAMEALKEA